MPDSLRKLDNTEFARGSNCAQSVLAYYAQDERFSDIPITTAVGSGFGGGLGNTGCLCGALAGSIMVVGYYVDSLNLEPVAARALGEKMTQELVERFKEHYKATCCRVIRRTFCEGTKDVHHCNALVAFMNEQTNEVLNKYANADQENSNWHALDIINGLDQAARVILVLSTLLAALSLGGIIALPSRVLSILATIMSLSIFCILAQLLWRYIRYHRR